MQHPPDAIISCVGGGGLIGGIFEGKIILTAGAKGRSPDCSISQAGESLDKGYIISKTKLIKSWCCRCRNSWSCVIQRGTYGGQTRRYRQNRHDCEIAGSKEDIKNYIRSESTASRTRRVNVGDRCSGSKCHLAICGLFLYN